MSKTNLNIIDPNDVISNLPSFMNGAPDYEKMYLFVELTAERKTRTVLESKTVGTTKVNTGLDKDVSISMMGYDQTSKNNTEHTTKYAFNTQIGNQVYEGFGISNIKIETNSSFIPKVSIEFLDIRGNSFAQSKDSIYNILFDFPPPIYRLTVKGYFGRALTYELHLVKYNIKFSANDGNYVISAEFVARTFAPLTDLLFKYVETFPLIDYGTVEDKLPVGNQEGIDDANNPATANSNVLYKPINTYELIIKLESLYDKIAKAKDTTAEAKEYKKAQNQKNTIQTFYNTLSTFTTKYDVDPQIKESGVFIIKNDTTVDQQNNMRIGTLKDYNTYLKTTGSETINNNPDQKLLLGFPVNNEAKSIIISTELKRLRKEILGDAHDIDQNLFNTTNKNAYIIPTINDDFVGPPPINNTFIAPTILNNNSYGGVITDQEKQITYKFIDITLLYTEIYRKWGKSIKTFEEKQKQLVGIINNIVEEQLGMRPTIYNIFKVICDDIDKFFDRIKTTSIKAEKHHDIHNKLIVSDIQNGIKDKKVTAFPLFVSGETICNVKRQARRMPTSANIGQPTMPEFPEAILVQKFMETFISMEKDKRVNEMKTQVDTNGNSKWIPVTPADSVLFNDIDVDSPYANLFGEGKSINKIYEIFLNRFYTQSQFTYGYDFFQEEGKIIPKHDELIKYLAETEAVNISQSLTETLLITQLLNQIPKFKKDGLEEFKTYLNDNVPNYNNIIHNEFLTLQNHTNLYRYRGNSGYTGIKILLDEEVLVRAGQNTSDPVDKYLSEIEETTFETFRTWFGEELQGQRNNKFSKENIPIFPDHPDDNKYTSSYFMPSSDSKFESSILFNVELESNNTVDEIIENCSNITVKETSFLGGYISKDLGDFIKGWSYLLSYEPQLISNFFKPDTINPDVTHIIQDVILSSNLLRSVGYFNEYMYVNNMMKYPAVLEQPYYASIYMGGLVKVSKDDILKQDLIDFLNSEIGQNIRKDTALIPSVGATYILYDLDKISLMSEKDKTVLENIFDNFHEKESSGIKNSIINMVEVVKDEFAGVTTDLWDWLIFNSKREQIEDRFAQLMRAGGQYENISNLLTKKIYVLNLTQFSFSNGKNADPSFYKPLSELFEDTNKSNILNNYFNTFFRKLETTLNKDKKELKELEVKFESNINDNDIKTQTYYSFKNMNDKWIAGQNNVAVKGFPFNKPNSNDSLINKFAFVDRAMNPIGDDVIINAEPLVDMIKDYDLSVFTVFSRLLSHNGFEFFPLQNFMAYEESEWEDSFKMFEVVDGQTATPSFVCMYIGGTSSFLKNENSQYEDDGLDLNDMSDVDDFSGSGCNKTNEVVDKGLIDGKTKYPYSQVRAFRVRYSEQNQSVFTNVDIDSREYPETNESLAILSKIAQDESAASPVPKAQNLYNTYETRAYTAKVSMFGDAMIQPTQYFQLENIPIFSGAYVILSVEHTIVPNKMTTLFSGVKVLKFPNPFVKEYATVVGLNSGTSEDQSGGGRTSNGVGITSNDGGSTASAPDKDSYGDAGAATLPIRAQHNSLYDLQIKPEPILNAE